MVLTAKPFYFAMNLAFLHTADVHINTFDTLLTQAGYTDAVFHTVRADLLDRARVDGIDSVADDVIEELDRIVQAADADLIVCTCSTIGDLAENAGVKNATVWRVDRPLMETAVSKGNRILLACTLESTLKPSRDLLESVLPNPHNFEIIDYFCAEAWPYFAQDDLAGYAQAIADALSGAPQTDVIILAQASMAGAIPLCENVDIPILDSPTTAVSAIMDLVNQTPLRPS